jgi:hypothetical protein
LVASGLGRAGYAVVFGWVAGEILPLGNEE